ncbi:DUF535 family protein [Noviherbaspirillum denitrificans]|uniref:UspA domain-containing protein n=1 Tax=Noviherbaspirillum denitrificans TaxID=1968433 RepID=A0A254TFX1_9BURK|nr:DUF535 family protein [Noviherbaspirillum denitrificans]OWW21556.1 hypothetical protein AYR66_20745 [Noviherbaspirillum denitrificans]
MKTALRLLVPVKELSDVDIALAHASRLGRQVEIILLHVVPAVRPHPGASIGAGTAVHDEDLLLMLAAMRCKAHVIPCESYVFSGVPARVIVDASELLSCDQIVMRSSRRRRGPEFFSPRTVAEVSRHARHIPLVLVARNAPPERMFSVMKSHAPMRGVTIRSGASAEKRRIPFLREWIKLELRALLHWRHTRQWLGLLNSHPAFSELVQRCPRLLYKIYRPYLSGTLSMCDRIAVIASHYSFVDRKGLMPLVIEASAAGVRMGTVEGKSGTRYEIRLHAVGMLEREGELVLRLSELDGMDLASIAFTFADVNEVRTLRIGCMQGPKSEEALAAIRHATRELHGMRPKHLLALLVRHLGHALGFGKLRLVGNANRVVHGAMRQGRVRADYDQLWQEIGALPRPDGDFEISCARLQPPDLSDVASKKRAEARRRHDVVMQLATDVERQFLQRTGRTRDDEQPTSHPFQYDPVPA